jgi:hypothetical protein
MRAKLRDLRLVVVNKRRAKMWRIVKHLHECERATVAPEILVAPIPGVQIDVQVRLRPILMFSDYRGA